MTSSRNEAGHLHGGDDHALHGRAALDAATCQDAHEGPPEVDVAQGVAQGVDGAVDVAQPVA